MSKRGEEEMSADSKCPVCQGEVREEQGVCPRCGWVLHWIGDQEAYHRQLNRAREAWKKEQDLNGQKEGKEEEKVSPDQQITVVRESVRSQRTGNWLTFKAHNGDINCLNLSNSGNLLCTSATHDENVKLWEIKGRSIKLLHEYNLGPIQSTFVWDMAISPDGQFLAVVWNQMEGERGCIIVWETSNHSVIRRLIYTDFFTCVRFTPDGHYMVTGNFDGAILLGKLGEENLREIYRDRMGEPVDSLSISPNGQYIAAGYDNSNVCIFDVNGGKFWNLVGQASSVYSVEFSPCSQYLATGDDSSTIKLWKVNEGKLLWLVKEDDAVVSLAFSPDGKFLASVTNSNLVKLWSVGSGTHYKTIDLGKEQIISRLVFSSNNCLIMGTGNGEIGLVNLEEIIRCGKTNCKYKYSRLF